MTNFNDSVEVGNAIVFDTWHAGEIMATGGRVTEISERGVWVKETHSKMVYFVKFGDFIRVI